MNHHATPTDGDVNDIFDAYRLICIARNYPDAPATFADLAPGTQATIRAAAEIRARERNLQPAPRRARVVTIAKGTVTPSWGNGWRSRQAGD